jgi:hypothetical protein
MDDAKDRPSLLRQDADSIRKAQTGGEPSGTEAREGGPEGNDAMREVWSQPGGEAHAYRNATVAAGTKADGHEELTAAETPETTRHLSDASLGPEDRDATGEALARMNQPAKE